MKKMIYLAFALLLLSATSMKAQVAIGNDPALTTPSTGTILDLRHVTGNNLGLLLPKVTLTSASLWTPIEGTKVDGMLVYNDNDITSNSLKGISVYVWYNDRWNKMGLF